MAYSLDTGLIAIAAYGVLILVNQMVCTFLGRSLPPAQTGTIQLRNVKIFGVIRNLVYGISPAVVASGIGTIFILISCVFIIGISVRILIYSEIADFAGLFRIVFSFILAIPVIFLHLTFLNAARKQLTPGNSGVLRGLCGGGYFVGVYMYFTSFNLLWLVLVVVAAFVLLLGLFWPIGKQ